MEVTHKSSEGLIDRRRLQGGGAQAGDYKV